MLSDSYLLRLKAHCLATGIQLTEAATWHLSDGGEVPLTVHEYATTGGVTIRIGDVFINAPFDDWFSARSRAWLDVNAAKDCFEVKFDDESVPCEVLPLPGYLDAVNDLGNGVTTTTMSHCDRIRVSPITGCSLDCGFCDFPSLRYTRHDAADVLASIEVAKRDTNLPPRHMLISGGSPGPNHFDWFDDTLATIIESAGIPTDIMMSPREGGTDYIKRYVDAGACGFSFNLEIYGDAAADDIMPRKHRRSTPFAARVARLGAASDSRRINA